MKKIQPRMPGVPPEQHDAERRADIMALMRWDDDGGRAFENDEEPAQSHPDDLAHTGAR
jgi:hypothetical protein